MAVSFKVPKSPAKSILTIDTFLGADFTNSPASCENTKSPNTVNMIRDVPGKIRKCMGYETVATYKDTDQAQTPLPINGFHTMRGDDYGIIHAGTKLFYKGAIIYTGANNARSKSWEFESKLYILDGKKFLVAEKKIVNSVETFDVKAVESVAYTPTVTISKDPEGGGTPYEDLNLLTPAFTETFLGKVSVKDYNLSFQNLDETEPIVEVMDANGDFQTLTYGTDYSVSYSTGVISFINAPGVSPLSGEDNVRITA